MTTADEIRATTAKAIQAARESGRAEALAEMGGKAIGMKPKCYEDKYMHCPACDEFLAYKYSDYPNKLNTISFEALKYCWECGQKLDWEGYV